MENVTSRYHPWWCKTGLIVSTTQETTRFFSALFSGALLERESFLEMQRWVLAGGDAGPFFRKPAYGLGLMIDPDWGYGGLYGHGGGGPGYCSWAMVLPDFDGRTIVLAIFCNTSMGGQPLDLVKDLLYVLKDA
jgi:D-alanyl-D-alanine carboxypeptidase